MSSSSGSSCKTNSGRCALCGEYLGNTSVPIVGYGSPPTEGKGAFTKLKPLRWRFLSNKAPRTKLMCAACAEKRQAPQQTEGQAVSPDAKDVDSFQKRSSKPSDQVLKLEHLQEPRDKQRRAQDKQKARVLPQKREKFQPEPRERQNLVLEPRSEGRRRGSSQTSDPTPRSSRGSVLHPFSNHRASRESVMRNRPVSVSEMGTRYLNTKSRAASVDTPSRPRKVSTGQLEPRTSEKKESRRSQTDQRTSSTADILGMSRAIELPPNYFDRSSTSPKFTMRHLEMNSSPQLEPRKQHETEEERQRRRSVSYARMLMRMRSHYDAVQVNGAQGPPATAPPRRVRAERRAKSVAVRNVQNNPVHNNFAGLALDLEYLRAYKDAR